jgi:hypothetical protein
MSDTRQIEHPGIIQCIDGATQEVVDTIDAKEVPSSHRFVKNQAGERVPVVKMVASVEREQFIVRNYGPDGELLRTHVRGRGPK